jgi:hypothetical protein
MILIEFLKRCKKLVDENPDALKMEMFAVHGASGAIEEISSPFVEKLSEFGEDEREIYEHILPNDYPLDSIVWVYIGN